MFLLASVLKPVDDTRMRGKFAETLRERPGVRVHVAGRAAPGAGPAPARVFQHVLFAGFRLSWARLLAQWRYARLLHRLRPTAVVVHAPELLPLTLLWQARAPGRHFLYDIRENYALNVSTQRVYRGLVQRGLAAGLRWVEARAANRAAALLLAEASYGDELPFLRRQPPGRVLVLENKYQPAPDEHLSAQPVKLPATGEPLRLLYSGTISDLNGVWEAVDLARALRAAWPGGALLTVIGFCQQPAVLRRLQETAARESDWLTLIGGPAPVPHADIVAAIGRSHVGLLPYRPHASTARCRPTKLFEYLAHGLPIITSPNVLWLQELQAHGAGLQLDFSAPLDGAALAARLRTAVFYPNGPPADALWTAEGKKLWLLLDSIF